MQALEKQRLTKMRNMLWMYTNICSHCLVDIDNRYEQVGHVFATCLTRINTPVIISVRIALLISTIVITRFATCLYTCCA